MCALPLACMLHQKVIFAYEIKSSCMPVMFTVWSYLRALRSHSHCALNAAAPSLLWKLQPLGAFNGFVDVGAAHVDMRLVKHRP